MGNFKGLMNAIGGFVKEHSPEILIGIGITGTVTAIVSAARSTKKAVMIVTEEERARQVEELPSKEKFKLVWRCYLPAAMIEMAAIACILGASSINNRRNMALATAYNLSETAFREYEHKVIETLGEKKDQKIKDEVAKERVEKNPVKSTEVIVTEKGNTLCLDVTSGRYFRSDADKLRKIENEINRRLRDEINIPLNDFYYEIGLEETSTGRDLGWNIDHGYLSIYFSTQIAANDEPCLVVNYDVVPIGFAY